MTAGEGERGEGDRGNLTASVDQRAAGTRSFADRKDDPGLPPSWVLGTFAAVVVDVVLPVLDEADALPVVLRSLPPGFRPIVVDNGSSDGSAAVAQRLGAAVVAEDQRGFGAACAAGLAAATAELVCFMDCDGSLDGADLPRVCAPVLAGEADLVLGRRVAAAAAPSPPTWCSPTAPWPPRSGAAPARPCATSARCAPCAAPTSSRSA